LVATRRVPCNRKITKIQQKEGREAAEIRSQLVEEEGDGFIEEDCSVD
jgi:hypothetical protein